MLGRVGAQRNDCAVTAQRYRVTASGQQVALQLAEVGVFVGLWGSVWQLIDSGAGCDGGRNELTPQRGKVRQGIAQRDAVDGDRIVWQ